MALSSSAIQPAKFSFVAITNMFGVKWEWMGGSTSDQEHLTSTAEPLILNIIRKLSKIPITLEILEATHIGKIIRKLSKRDDAVGAKAKGVLNKWRDIFIKSEVKNLKSSSNSKREHTSVNKNSSSECETMDDKINQNKHSLFPRPEQDIQIKEISSTVLHYKTKEKEKNKSLDSNAGVSGGYNPELPELFSPDKVSKISKTSSISTYKPSLKHKSNDTESTDKTVAKKLKLGHSEYSVPQKSEQKVGSDKEQNGDSPSKNKKSSYKTDNPVLQKVSSDAKKTKENSAAKKTSSAKVSSSEEFTSSEMSFEDCLTFNDDVQLKRKGSKSHPLKKPQADTANFKNNSPVKKTSLQHQEVKTVKKSSLQHQEVKTSKSTKFSPTKENLVINVPKPKSHSSKVDVADIYSTLPEIQPNYRPLPRDFANSKKKEVLSNEQAIKFTSSRREKTAVYSGRRHYDTELPSLQTICIRVLIENIDAIEYVGGVPYFLLKPVLEKCTPIQLFNIENFNHYLVEDTNELWEIHCKRDYKLLKPLEHESWRDLYLRAHDEQEQKLKNITANISASISKSKPVRQVKLAYVDVFAKPPRDVARRQAKNGTAVPVSHPVKTGPPSKATPRPTAPVINSAASASAGSSSNTSYTANANYIAPKKPKVAPLMAKTLKSMKQCFRRK